MQLPRSQADAAKARCKRIEKSHKAMAKPLGLVLDYDWRDLLKLVTDSPCCRWCRLPVGFDFHCDHVHPLARGGAMALYNLCVACSRCNQMKGQLLESCWLELREVLSSWHPADREDLEARLLAGGPARYARGRQHAGRWKRGK